MIRYFDYNATTPLDGGVRATMLPHLSEVWGNPSSIHRVGNQARALLDESRESVAHTLGCRPSEIIFTSGGTESSNLAICGTARALKSRGNHIITSAIEHHAVLHTCQYLAKHEGFELTVLPVSGEGRVNVETVAKAIRPESILVSIMAANNEIGSLQPVDQIGDLCRQRGILFHTDAVQWFGKEPFRGIDQFNADLVSICAHKIHGPKGAGALYLRSPLMPHPIQFGGSHENERRAGTENLLAIVGFAACLSKFLHPPVFPLELMVQLTDRLRSILETIEGVQIVTPRNGNLKNTLACVVDGVDSISLLAALDLEGVCVSNGSACSAGSSQPSHVIQAIGKATSANSLIRFSFGRENTLAEVDTLKTLLPNLIRRAQLSK